jgi:hypothetical protein
MAAGIESAATICVCEALSIDPGISGSANWTLSVAFPTDELSEIVPVLEAESFQTTSTAASGAPVTVQLPESDDPAIVPELIQTCMVDNESQLPLIVYWYTVPATTQVGPLMVTCETADRANNMVKPGKHRYFRRIFMA